MSLLSWITLAVITVSIYMYRKWNRLRLQKTLLILLFIQLFMATGENVFLQAIWMIVFLLSVMFFKPVETKIKMLIIIGLILITTVYVEFFNGVETFSSRDEFFLYHEKVNEYFWMLPQKTFKDHREFIYVFTLESKINAGPSAGFFVTQVKLQDSELYYLGVKKGKLGQLPYSGWFKFGEKEDWSRIVA